MDRRLRVPIIVGLGLFAALAAAAALSNASVSFRSAQRDGNRVAEVLIGERVVIVLRTAAGGYTPLERAEVVANRLRAAMAEEIKTEQVEVGPLDSGHGVFIADGLTVAVTESEAEAHGATTEALARQWRDNLLLALGLEVPGPGASEQAPPPAQETPAATPAAEAPPAAEQTPPAETPPAAVDWTGAAQKWVPIFSLTGEGVSAGMAQVAGPTAQMEKVKAVAELRLNFQNFGRIYTYIPVSSISMKPQRIQGVSVWAIADVKLVNF